MYKRYMSEPQFDWLCAPALLTYLLLLLFVFYILYFVKKYPRKILDNLGILYFGTISVFLLTILIFLSPDDGALLRRVYYSTIKPFDIFNLGLLAIFVWLLNYLMCYHKKLREAIISGVFLVIFILPGFIQSTSFNVAALPPEMRFYTPFWGTNYVWLLVVALVLSIIFSILSKFILKDENRVFALSMFLALTFKLTATLVFPDLFSCLFKLIGFSLFTPYVRQVIEFSVPWYTPSDYIYDIIAHPIIAELPVILTPEAVSVLTLSAGSTYLLTKNALRAMESALIIYFAIYVVGTIVFAVFGYLTGF